MTIRKLPFGYRIQAGQIQVVEQEADAVRMIFNHYTAGTSYGRLADELNGLDVPYTPDKPWNKNMVARILQDERYMGGAAYPQIVTPESFHRARAAKPNISGTVSCAEIKDIRILARCGVCSEPVQRKRKNYWLCPRCMESPAKIKDEHLILCVDRLLRRLCEQPDTVNPSPAIPADSTAIQCAQDSFARELDKPEFDEGSAKAKALALAAAKFDALGSQDFESMRIHYMLEQNRQQDSLTDDLLRKITTAVLIHPTGAVSLKLKNDKIIEELSV